ncbi:uncharacterized protein G2W53_016473 [Senna tora]|uniref:Uncharacterized protein n=1 Tax=Senna tora TaxID=362788 RepID=A0A834TPG9_9FABA|nr:uncharacterized protein G2W53_016473 [Senna tora]
MAFDGAPLDDPKYISRTANPLPIVQPSPCPTLLQTRHRLTLFTTRLRCNSARKHSTLPRAFSPQGPNTSITATLAFRRPYINP